MLVARFIMRLLIDTDEYRLFVTPPLDGSVSSDGNTDVIR